jgi:hypothetical protein
MRSTSRNRSPSARQSASPLPAIIDPFSVVGRLAQACLALIYEIIVILSIPKTGTTMQTYPDRCPHAKLPDDPAFGPNFAPKFPCQSAWHLRVKQLSLNGFMVLYGYFQGAKRVFSLSSGKDGLSPAGWSATRDGVSGPGELTAADAIPILRRFPARGRSGGAGIAEARREPMMRDPGRGHRRSGIGRKIVPAGSRRRR